MGDRLEIWENGSLRVLESDDEELVMAALAGYLRKIELGWAKEPQDGFNDSSITSKEPQSGPSADSNEQV